MRAVPQELYNNRGCYATDFDLTAWKNGVNDAKLESGIDGRLFLQT